MSFINCFFFISKGENIKGQIDYVETLVFFKWNWGSILYLFVPTFYYAPKKREGRKERIKEEIWKKYKITISTTHIKLSVTLNERENLIRRMMRGTPYSSCRHLRSIHQFTKIPMLPLCLFFNYLLITLFSFAFFLRIVSLTRTIFSWNQFIIIFIELVFSLLASLSFCVLRFADAHVQIIGKSDKTIK